jgi:hypothetical protein
VNGSGVVGESISGPGVFGNSDGSPGVVGRSHGGPGVDGKSDLGPGVLASSNDGDALRVDGRARFTTARSGVIPLGQDKTFVSNSAVTSESHITATLTGSPGSVVTGFPAVIQWLERRPGLGFVIHLTRKVGQATPFTYLIVEPG